MVSRLAQPGRRQRAQGLDGDGSSSTTRPRTSSTSSSVAPTSSPARPTAASGGTSTAGALLERYLEHRAGLARRDPLGSCASWLDCANGAGGAVAPEILGRHRRLGRGPSSTSRTAPTSTSGAARRRPRHSAGAWRAGRRRRRLRPRRRRRPMRGRRRARPASCDGDQLLGIIALDRLAPWGARRQHARGQRPLQRRAGDASSRQPAAASSGRRSATSYILDAMLVAGAGLGGEKSGHVIVAEHASTGDGIADRAGGPARPGRRRAAPLGAGGAGAPVSAAAARRPRPPQGPMGGGPATVGRRAGPPRRSWPGRGRVLVRPSGTEPALRIMVEGEDADRVVALADALAALAVERLN